MTSILRKSTVRLLTWRGRLIQVRYEPEWLGGGSFAHLTVTTLRPPQGPLPVSETGFRSHFLDAEKVDVAGGAVAYVQGWLNEAAKNRRWIAAEDAARQLSLF